MSLINRKKVHQAILANAQANDSRTTKTWTQVTVCSVDKVEDEVKNFIRRMTNHQNLPRVGKTVKFD
jgi:hypothetical protein